MSSGGADEVRVRYGRARLTVARSGPLDRDDPLGRAIDEYARGETRATSVARAYLRSRVVDHTPSFTWRNARLSELVPLVTAVSAAPKLKAETSTELADELVRIRSSGLEIPAPAPVPAPEHEPRPAAAPAATDSRPRRPKPRGLRAWVPALALVVCLAAVAWGLVRLFGDDDPTTAAQPQAAGAATAVAESMDYVFSVYDLYVGGLEREPLAEAIEEARAAIGEHRAELAAEGAPYLDEASAFLDRLEATLAQGRDAVLDDDEAIYRSTVRLGRQADALEDDPAADHYRPRPPD